MLISLTSVLVNCAAAAPIYYSGNGHFYDAIYVPGGITWEEANDKAQSSSYSGINGHLATITSQEENNFIVNNFGLMDYWLGGFQPDGSSEPDSGWQWVTGETWDYTNWDISGEPNNHYWGGYVTLNNDPTGTPENTLQFHYNDMWNDLPDDCLVPSYIVEYDAESASSTPVYYSGNGHYYQAIYVPEGITWEEAKTAAQSLSYSDMNGHLATITSQDENDFIANSVGGYRCWLGGIQSSGSLNPADGWQWVTDETWDYTNWAGGEPNDDYGGERGVLPPRSPEEALEFWGFSGWNDYPSVVPLDGYIVEYGIEIINNPPVAVVNGPYTGNEASPITFDATGSSDPDEDSLTYEWDLDSDGVFEISSSEPTATYTWGDDYTGAILLKVMDEEGLSATASTTVIVNNVAPTATATGAVISEDGIATVSGTIIDPSPTDTFEVAINWGDGNTETFPYAASSTEFSETHQYLDDDPSGTSSDDYIVIVTVKDDEMSEGTASTTITVNNVAPVVDAINSPVDPIKTGEEISVDSTFTDAGGLDTHTAVWDWNDSLISDGTVTETDGSGKVSGKHTYSSADIYEIKLTVTDDDLGSNYSVSKYVVVYDPEGGFVTGGGWISSPEGAYASDTTLAGTANFGFVSKYKKGATVPTGVTLFNFQVADLNFHSDTYEWLVIAGSRAQYKGTGTINGEGEYGFMLTAIDGQINSVDDPDRFRIKIWDKASDAVVYDNMLSADDTADLTTEIQGGSITIHKE